MWGFYQNPRAVSRSLSPFSLKRSPCCRKLDLESIQGKIVIKKRLPGKMRQIPDYYFLPRRSLPSAIAFYGAICAAGIGAGMLVEIWINKKVKEDGDSVLWEI
ncbi:hypothetical protein MRB53_024359 [Persea americana]|uniref:Uncharacterized protein n=1 Tax=Persea americana TaxID=3435 RepID=A0ACC2LC92_PERAE|nr:hypothetical protein MRB53_024359 [Persea americana]